MVTDHDGVEPHRATQEIQPHQWRPRQREAASPVIPQQLAEGELLLVRGKMRPVMDCEVERRCPVHDLQRSVESLPVEAGSEDAVPVDGALPGALQQGEIQRSLDGVAELHDAGASVRRVEGLEQHPLLHRRQREDVLDLTVHGDSSMSAGLRQLVT